MKAIRKRLERLETLFAPRAAKEDDWGSLTSVHVELLRLAAGFGEPRCSEITAELDALGPAGLWNEAVRGLLANHGFVQTGHESFAETIARSLDIGMDELRVCMAQGQIGSALLRRFEERRIATDNEKYSIGSAHVRKSQGAGAVGVSTADRIH